LRLLIDTHALLWLAYDTPQLSRAAAAHIADPDNEAFCSDVVAWEIAIKASLGDLSVPGPVDQWFVEQLRIADIERVPIALAAIAAVRDLPWHHKDPFDRLLAATALTAGLTLVSKDAVFDAYGVKRVW
jgi:PIN domain nuclease of toxin-antitoxin system